MKEDNNDNAIKNPFLRVDLLFDEKIKELKKEIEDKMRREKEEFIVTKLANVLISYLVGFLLLISQPLKKHVKIMEKTKPSNFQVDNTIIWWY